MSLLGFEIAQKNISWLPSGPEKLGRENPGDRDNTENVNYRLQRLQHEFVAARQAKSRFRSRFGL